MSTMTIKRNFYQVKKITLMGFVLSLFVHLLFSLSFQSFDWLKNFQIADNIKKLEQLDKNQNLSKTKIQLNDIQELSPKVLEQLKKIQKSKVANRPRQIVATENSDKVSKKMPKEMETRFLGEKDRFYEKQTMTKNNGTFQEMGKGVANGVNQVAKPVAEPVAEAKKVQKISQSDKTQNSHKKIKDLSLKDFGIGPKSLDTRDLIANAQTENSIIQELPQINLKDTDVDHKLEKSANELSSNTLGGAEGQIGKSGLSRSNDFVDDIPLGEVTHLNTQEFKYYGFYNRIKQQLEQFWGKSISEKARSLYRSGRRLPGNEQLITSVTVILNEKGDILNILIDGSSGVKELDQAAVESFKKAGPFPNPPKGLVVNGRAVIQWGFVVKS